MARHTSIDRKALGITLGFAALWLAAALAADGATFHLGPVIVAGAAPAVATRNRPGAVAAGLAGALVVGLVLYATGNLDGPSLLPWGDAALESAVGAAVGAIVGVGAGYLLAPGRDAPAA